MKKWTKDWEIQRNSIIFLILILIMLFSCIATAVIYWPKSNAQPDYLMTPTPNVYSTGQPQK
jgi:hypothetical protein